MHPERYPKFTLIYATRPSSPRSAEGMLSYTSLFLSFYYIIERLIPTLYAALDCGPLSIAVVANDINQVNHILTNWPATILERDLLGQTPIHHAVCRPDCLRFLLKFADADILNAVDFQGMTPISVALHASFPICCCPETDLCEVQCHCTSALELLLNSDCALTNMLYTGSLRACMKYSGALKNRRERLKRLAMQHLPLSEVDDLVSEEGIVLDARAEDVIERLQYHGVEIPAALNVGEQHGRSIYHFLSNVEQANIFFDLGFRDVDIPDIRGHPPLTETAPFPPLSYSPWLVEHGAELSHRIRSEHHLSSSYKVKNTATSAHHVLRYIGFRFRHNLKSRFSNTIFDYGAVTDDDEAKIDSIIRLHSHILPVDERDECDCRCCYDGCSPLLWMLQSVFRDIRSATSLETSLFISLYLKTFGFSMGLKYHMDALRWATFEVLCIQHTCCFNYWRPHRRLLDIDNIKEIVEEQADLLQILEKLVGEFGNRITEILGRDNSDTLAHLAFFWTVDWYTRMQEVLAELDGNNLSEEERRAAEDIGVKWDDELSDEEEDEQDEEYEEDEEDKKDIGYWFRRIEEIAP